MAFPKAGKPDLNSDPSAIQVAVTPADGTDLPGLGACRGLYIGVTGDVTVVPYEAPTTSVLFKNAQQGSILPIMAIRVKATGTTATNIVALY